MTHKPRVTFLVALLSLFITGCFVSVEKTKTACEADNLLLTISSFPTKVWEEIGSRDKRGAPSRLGLERAGTSFSTQTQGGASQDFYRFATMDEAAENYVELQTDWFNLAPQSSTWISPNELKDIRLGADKYRLGCSKDVIETCWFIALYRTYVVEFEVDMPSLTYSDLVRLLQGIDQKMMSCVNN